MDARHFSEDDWALFTRLLKRYAEYELDQFEAWRVSTAYGDVYIRLVRELRGQDGPPEAYTLL